MEGCQTEIRALAIEPGRQRVEFALLAIFEDLFVAGLDFLEPRHRPAHPFGDPERERRRIILFLDAVLLDAAVDGL